jgi:hypothetical protein
MLSLLVPVGVAAFVLKQHTEIHYLKTAIWLKRPVVLMVDAKSDIYS